MLFVWKCWNLIEVISWNSAIAFTSKLTLSLLQIKGVHFLSLVISSFTTRISGRFLLACLPVLHTHANIQDIIIINTVKSLVDTPSLIRWSVNAFAYNTMRPAFSQPLKSCPIHPQQNFWSWKIRQLIFLNLIPPWVVKSIIYCKWLSDMIEKIENSSVSQHGF
jgi:hypothetical protein